MRYSSHFTELIRPAAEAQLKFLISLQKGTPPNPKSLAYQTCTPTPLLDLCVRSTGAPTVTSSLLVGNMGGRCGALLADALLGGSARSMPWMKTGERHWNSTKERRGVSCLKGFRTRSCMEYGSSWVISRSELYQSKVEELMDLSSGHPEISNFLFWPKGLQIVILLPPFGCTC